MKRTGLIALVVLVLLAIGIWLVRQSQPAPLANSTNESNATHATPSASPVTRTNFLGETILRGYAETNLPPENDLTLIARLMESSLLLLKAAANRPLSANEDWADLLRGKNVAHEEFLPATHVALNDKGQLVDRWQTPLFFHALGGGRFELRSAGPDRKLWTADDIHRNADGSFRRGAQLNPPSLASP